jgi:hypothetical protein
MESILARASFLEVQRSIEILPVPVNRLYNAIFAIENHTDCFFVLGREQPTPEKEDTINGKDPSL